jgi:hypothetical protein
MPPADAQAGPGPRKVADEPTGRWGRIVGPVVAAGSAITLWARAALSRIDSAMVGRLRSLVADLLEIFNSAVDRFVPWLRHIADKLMATWRGSASPGEPPPAVVGPLMPLPETPAGPLPLSIFVYHLRRLIHEVRPWHSPNLQNVVGTITTVAVVTMVLPGSSNSWLIRSDFTPVPTRMALIPGPQVTPEPWAFATVVVPPATVAPILLTAMLPPPTVVPPPAFVTAIPPPAFVTAMPPPAFVTAMPPPAFVTAMPPPAFVTVMPPPATVVPPPDLVTAVPPPPATVVPALPTAMLPPRAMATPSLVTDTPTETASPTGTASPTQPPTDTPAPSPEATSCPGAIPELPCFGMPPTRSQLRVTATACRVPSTSIVRVELRVTNFGGRLIRGKGELFVDSHAQKQSYLGRSALTQCGVDWSISPGGGQVLVSTLVSLRGNPPLGDSMELTYRTKLWSCDPNRYAGASWGPFPVGECEP